MRILLVLTCCVGLALFAAAAPTIDDSQNPQYKKKGGNAPAQNVVAPTTIGGAKIKGKGQYKYNANPSLNVQQPSSVRFNKKNKWQGPVTGQTQTSVSGNVSGNPAYSTKFNKSKFGAQGNLNATGGGNFKYQKKQFNLQTNNKQFVINKYKTVNFNNNYKIAGAQKWKGSKYMVFKNYQPQWHDTWWWNWHHPHVTFIYGGWYYWDNNYWYPAWGYAPDSVYYYDGPIYSSNPSEDPAQVVANVQSALQEQGYYQGEIDGVLGPQTRAALAEFQSSQGLEPTGAVDEPTLETLGMA